MMDISLKGKEQGMNDDKIVDLYWIRSEDAITETSIKYGKYCYGIAYNILADAEDAHTLTHGILCLRTARPRYLRFWEN